MEITSEGGSSFSLRGEGRVAVNPQGAVEKGEIALHGVRRKKGADIVNGPGEYEIGGVMITSVRHGDRESQLLAHSVTLDGVAIAFVGDGSVAVSNADAEALGKVDVLLIGASDVRGAQAIVGMLEPRVVIPFGAKAEELVAALGVKDAKPQPRFTWNGTASVPKAVLLKAPATRKRAA